MIGNIPVLFVEGNSLAEAWEKSVISVYNEGCDIKTEYDKAAFMNMFAFIQLQLKIAEIISKHSDKEILLGRYVHQADSYHIYGSYFREFKERFIKALETRSFEERTYRYEDMKILMDEAIPDILEKASIMK